MNFDIKYLRITNQIRWDFRISSFLSSNNVVNITEDVKLKLIEDINVKLVNKPEPTDYKTVLKVIADITEKESIENLSEYLELLICDYLAYARPNEIVFRKESNSIYFKNSILSVRELISNITMNQKQLLQESNRLRRENKCRVFIVNDALYSSKKLDNCLMYDKVSEVPNTIIYQSLKLEILKDEINEDSLLLACDYITYASKNIAYLDKGKIYLNSNTIKNKEELLNYFFDSKPKSKDDILVDLEYILKLSSNVEEEDEYYILDGICAISKIEGKAVTKNLSDIPIIGYIKNGERIFNKVDINFYVDVETDHGNIKVLKTLYQEGLLTVYTYTNIFERSKVIERPYPVAILPNSKYAFIFEVK